jgi:hypothetical protein
VYLCVVFFFFRMVSMTRGRPYLPPAHRLLAIVAWRRRAVRSYFCAISPISQILGYRSLTQVLDQSST